MNAPNPIKETLEMPRVEMGSGVKRVETVFRWLRRLLLAVCGLSICYFLFASDRYVSTATIVIQNTDHLVTSGLDLRSLMSSKSGGGVILPDQLLLKEHLESLDMLKKIDAALGLRAHYADSSRDIGSRMWFSDYSLEWFYRHFKSRVEIAFDEFTGVLRVSAQAYEPQMAYDITTLLVKEGENYMNEMSHALARVQVNFLETQVEKAQNQVKDARDELVAFQNKKGIVSPKNTVDSFYQIIQNLEKNRTQVQTQLASLPTTLDENHPTRRSLRQSLTALEKQIAGEMEKLASANAPALNALMEEEARLEEEVKMRQDVYKNSLISLEKGRMDAARTIKLVAVIQAPQVPEYAVQPRRIYGVCATVIIGCLFLGALALLKSVVMDHVG